MFMTNAQQFIKAFFSTTSKLGYIVSRSTERIQALLLFPYYFYILFAAMELVSGTFAIDLSFVEAARREKDTEKRAEKLHRAQQANMHIEQT